MQKEKQEIRDYNFFRQPFWYCLIVIIGLDEKFYSFHQGLNFRLHFFVSYPAGLNNVEEGQIRIPLQFSFSVNGSVKICNLDSIHNLPLFTVGSAATKLLTMARNMNSAECCMMLRKFPTLHLPLYTFAENSSKSLNIYLFVLLDFDMNQKAFEVTWTDLQISRVIQ